MGKTVLALHVDNSLINCFVIKALILRRIQEQAAEKNNFHVAFNHPNQCNSNYVKLAC
jgi:hypothetical protein